MPNLNVSSQVHNRNPPPSGKRKAQMTYFALEGMSPEITWMAFAVDSLAFYHRNCLVALPATTFGYRKVATICLGPSIDAEEVSFTLCREGMQPLLVTGERKAAVGQRGPIFNMHLLPDLLNGRGGRERYYPRPDKLVTLEVKIKNAKLARFDFKRSEQEEKVVEEGADMPVTWRSLVDGGRIEHRTFARDIAKGYNNKDFHDFTIVCKDERFPCHKFILASRSEVLSMILSNNSSEAEKGELCIEDSDPEAVGLFLTYLYGGRTKKVTEGSVDLISRLLQLAEKYSVSGLSETCSNLLMEKINTENASDVLGMARMYKIEHLEERAKAFVARKAKDVVGTESWKDLVGSDPEVAGEIIYRLLDND